METDNKNVKDILANFFVRKANDQVEIIGEVTRENVRSISEWLYKNNVVHVIITDNYSPACAELVKRNMNVCWFQVSDLASKSFVPSVCMALGDLHYSGLCKGSLIAMYRYNNHARFLLTLSAQRGPVGNDQGEKKSAFTSFIGSNYFDIYLLQEVFCFL